MFWLMMKLLPCKSQHSEGGICIRILVGKQPGGEVSETVMAQTVMQFPPSECWDLQRDRTKNLPLYINPGKKC